MDTNDTVCGKSMIENHIDILRGRGAQNNADCYHSPFLPHRKPPGPNNERTQGGISGSLGYDVGSPTVYRIYERLASTGMLCSMHKSDGILRCCFCTAPRNENISTSSVHGV